MRVASALAFKNAPPGCCAATAGVSECHPPSAQAWTAADATEKPSLQRQSPEQAVTDSSALRHEPTEDPPQRTTLRTPHNAQTGSVTSSALVSSVKRDCRLTPEEGAKVCDQVAAAFVLAASFGSWCGIRWWGWRWRRNHILPLGEDVVPPGEGCVFSRSVWIRMRLLDFIV